MKMLSKAALATGAALALLAAAAPARAYDIDVAQYGSSTSGFPFAVSLEKGFFKEAGVTGIIGTIGGGQDVRNLVAAGLLYAEVSLPSAVVAIQKGADIKIVSEGAQNAASLAWATMPNSSINSVKDLKGKKMGYSSPQSFTQAAEFMMLDIEGYKKDEVTMVSTNGFGPGLTALEHGGVDVTVIPLPDLDGNPGKYKIPFWGRDIFPPLSNTVGVTPKTLTDAQQKQVAAILVGRRKGVEYMAAHREESAEIIAKAYKMKPEVVMTILKQLIDEGKVQGVPYWGLGNLDYPGMDNMVKINKQVGALEGDIDFSKMVDETLLTADLRSKK